MALVLIAAGILVPGGREGGVHLQFAIGGSDRIRTETAQEGIVQQTVQITRQRLRQVCPFASTATAGPPPDRITVECRAGVAPSALAGLLSSRARLEVSLVEGDPAPDRETLLRRHGGELHRTLIILPAQAPIGAAPAEYYVVRRPPVLPGAGIQDAQTTVDEFNRPAVTLTLRREAVSRMSKTTSANVGRLLAIVLDDRVISAPVIQEAIATSELRITGSFSQEEVRNLALMLRSGSLPRPVQLVEERNLPAEPGYPLAKMAVLAAGTISGAVAMLLLFGYLTDKRG